MPEIEFTPHDFTQMAARGITPEQVHAQILRFRQGFPFTRLSRPCTPGDGIVILSESVFERLGQVYEDAASEGRVLKFVPASGAGSRMFQYLLAVRNRYDRVTRNDLQGEDGEGYEDVRATLNFFAHLPRYAFYDDLRETMGAHALDDALRSGQYTAILDALLTHHGLNYPNLPKGLLPFHRYGDHRRTPFEEHMIEAIAYARDRDNVARIRFTVAPEHLNAVLRHIDAVCERYESPGLKMEITCSVQKSETDTIAVDPDNKPFRDQNGDLVFRAGGHGALLDSINDLLADIIVINNIDNVTPDYRKTQIHLYKRVLGGYLIEVQCRIFDYLKKLASGDVDQSALDEIMDFIRQTLCVIPPDEVMGQGVSRQCAYLMNRLNRPLRVCGMVKNTGAPGGGPFWIQHSDETVSLQIVESAQIDMDSEDQRAIFRASTHFNPVDLVCGVRDYTGQPFDLLKYRDPNTGFISSKSSDGKLLKAMELPGLWNGSMAHWNTIFVDVPGLTFNPVKTIDDLLRPEHQPEVTV